MSQFEQLASMKFFCKVGKPAAETHIGLLVVHGGKALKGSTVYDYHN
jgi:hypothetical protein